MFKIYAALGMDSESILLVGYLANYWNFIFLLFSYNWNEARKDWELDQTKYVFHNIDMSLSTYVNTNIDFVDAYSFSADSIANDTKNRGDLTSTIDTLIELGTYTPPSLEFLDGWGVAVKISKVGSRQLKILSAGSDKNYGTKDDVILLWPHH